MPIEFRLETRPGQLGHYFEAFVCRGLNQSFILQVVVVPVV